MYKISTTRRFDKDFDLCVKRGYNMELLLEESGTLPRKYNPHKLHGNFAGCWECHITPDWLLVWKQNN